MKQRECLGGISEWDRTLTRRIEGRVQVYEKSEDRQMRRALDRYFEAERSTEQSPGHIRKRGK